MNKKGSIKYVLPILVFLACLIIIQAITFQQIFPTENPFITNESTVNLSYGIHAPDGVSSITQSINGTNYTLYDSSLVLFMNFDNRSALGENDTIVKDLSMYGNNGSVVGGENITWTANGKYGGAFNFSGNKASINVGAINQLDYNKSFTIKLDFYYYNNNTDQYIIGDDKESGNKIWDLKFVATSRSIKFSFWNATELVLSSGNGISNNSWHNLIISFDRNTNNLTIYLDKKLNNSINISSWTTGGVGGVKYLYIGASRGTSSFFNGSIDEVMIFNRSLSASEISYLYNSQNTKYNSTYWEDNYTMTNSGNLQDYFTCSTNSTGSNFCSATKTIRQVNTIKVNFSNTIRIINQGGSYGASIDSCYFANSTYALDSGQCKLDTDYDGVEDTQANKTWILNNFYNAGIDFQRSGLDVTNYKNTTDSSGVNYSGSRDLERTASAVESAYLNNRKIIIQITNIPSWLIDNSSGLCMTTYQGNCTPSNYTKYANIINDAIMRVSNNGTYLSAMYFEIGNEPSLLGWSKENWTYFFNNISYSIHQINRSIKVGGGGCIMSSGYDSFCLYTLANMTDRDFYSYHGTQSLTKSIYSNEKLRLDYITSNCVGNCSLIIQSEGYSTAGNYYGDSNTSEQVMISIANKYLEEFNYKSNYTIYDIYYQFEEEASYYNKSAPSYYNASSHYPEYPRKFQLVNYLDNEISLAYYLISNLTRLCGQGATVSVTSNDDDTIKQVACKKGNQYSLIIINTDTNAKNVTLNLSRENGTMIFGFRKLTNYEDNTDTYTISSAGVVENLLFDSYEILYLVNDTQVPTITIDSPTNSTYLTNSVWMNVSLDEEGSMCKYSLNGGTNVTMTQSGVVSDFYSLKSSIEQITNYVIFYCNDTYNNWNSTKIYFTVSTPPTYSDNSVSNTIFGGDVRFSLTVTDDIALDTNGYWIFSSDNTGEWKNDTAVNFTSTPETISVRKNIIKPSNTNLSYRWYLYDNVGNLNVTETFSFTVACDSNTKVGYKLVMIIASLILLTFVISFSYSSFKEGKLDVGQLIMVFVVIVVCLALWLASGQNLGNNCGVIS